MTQVRMEIFTRIERNQALTLVKDAITSTEGWLVHHQLFSNMSASLLVELPVEQIEPFLSKLGDAGFSPGLDGKPPPAKGDTRIAISITFLHDEGDMKRDVPAFG